MNILMLGWEYPPHIAGGLGIACEGLTKGLSRPGTQITFVVPYLYGEEVAPHMRILDSLSSLGNAGKSQASEKPLEPSMMNLLGIPAFLQPYWTEEEYEKHREAQVFSNVQATKAGGSVTTEVEAQPATQVHEQHYGKDIFEEVSNFAYRVVQNLGEISCDIIHAHDWMTYPAGVALARKLGKPLVLHVHSLEYDRSGSNVNPRIHEIEHMGLNSADAVIAVSHYTKRIAQREYAIPAEKIFAVHNGIYPTHAVEYYREKHKDPTSKIVLFLGRVTFQKGPEYFIQAAAKVIPYISEALFVMAGSGDMLERIVVLTEELGISDHFQFPGFLKGKEVEQIFSIADLYVMPSVSEPFGLSVLEAINFDVPTLISKQSGVAEVVNNSLKFDFWDVDRLADLMINGLIHDEMRQDMITMAHKELDQLRWDASATKTMDVYNTVLNQRR